MWVPRRFGIVYTHEQQLCGLTCASDSMCWKGRLLLRWQPIPLLTSSPLSFSSYHASFPHTPTQTTHTIKLKENGPNHTFHKTWLLQLWAMKAQRRIRLGKVHAVITRHEICRKCLKNKGLFWKCRDQLNVTTVLDFGKLCLFSRGVENWKGSKSENKD